MRVFDTDVAVDYCTRLCSGITLYHALPEKATIEGFAYMVVIEG